MLTNKNIENAARVAMGQLVLDDAQAEFIAATGRRAVRTTVAAVMVAMVAAVVVSLFW